ncbi:hypothetical protein D0B32_03455 [Paraburkholderia sp. DHOC27]|nr:hypothetical protein D0B32_03455 [Paraburkholderia sp. DHOC27]
MRKVTSSEYASNVSKHAAQYDEKFTLHDSEARPLVDARYKIVVDGKRGITGSASAHGQSEHIRTDAATKLVFQVEQ